MRIYFAPCGIALGHAGRCIPVAKTFRRRGHSTYFSTYGEAAQFIRRAGFRVGEVPPIKVYEKGDGTFDLKRTLSIGPPNIYKFLLQVGAELDLIEQFKPDLVISDSRLSTILAARMRRIIPVLMLHQLRIMIPHSRPIDREIKKSIKSHVERLGLEVLGGLWKLSKVIIIPDFPPPYTIAKENVVPSYQYLEKLRLVGPIIPRYPSELPAKEEIRKELGLDDRPMIFAAISGTPAEKRLVVERLTQIFREFPDSYNIVLSKGISGLPYANSSIDGLCSSNGGDSDGDGSYVTARANNASTSTSTSTSIDVGDAMNCLMSRRRLKVYNWVDDRYKYLKACDLLITRGGHNTVAEAIYYGKPMVIIPTPAHSEHQGIAQSVEAMSLGVSIQQADLSREALLSGVRKVMDSTVCTSAVLRAQRYASNFNATESIYKIVCDTLRVPC